MIKNICMIQSPANEENEVREFIINQVKEYVDSYFVDDFGNLILNKKGNGKKLCIECGMDEPFLMVADNSGGKIRVSAPPHFSAKDFLCKKVIFKDKTVGEVKSEKDDENISFFDLYIESDSKKREIGEKAVLYSSFFEDKCEISSFNLRYKISAFLLIEFIKELSETKYNLYFVFSSQRCLAARGLKAFLTVNEFDIVLSVSGCKADRYISCGDGAVICAKEKNTVFSVDVRKELTEIAKKCGIAHKVHLLNENHNSRVIYTTGYGAKCALLCVPYSYDEKTGDKAQKYDIKNIIKLLIAYCK